MKRVGIIGNGFVGGAIAHGFSPAATANCQVRVYDKSPDRTVNSLEETVNESDYIFVSVPTPMDKSGVINLDYVRNAFKSIEEVNNRKDNVVILKSTVVPGTTDDLQVSYPKLNIIFNPEFLTERSARLDFINQNRIVLIFDVKGCIGYKFR